MVLTELRLSLEDVEVLARAGEVLKRIQADEAFFSGYEDGLSFCEAGERLIEVSRYGSGEFQYTEEIGPWKPVDFTLADADAFHRYFEEAVLKAAPIIEAHLLTMFDASKTLDNKYKIGL